MAGQRRTRILARLALTGTRSLHTNQLCEVAAEITGMSGAGVMLMSGDVSVGSLCTTDAVSALIEQSQYALGEGPCVDAYHQDRPVLEPDLAHPHEERWLAFRGPVVKAGARGVFGFPLQMGAARLGALNLYCLKPGPLSDDQHADALVMADVVAQAVLVLQADALPGQLTAELEAGADFHYGLHQASGMVAAQLDVSIAQALIRIRTYAFGNERPLADVAEDVVQRRLRFDAASGEKDPVP